ncbi:hypothetical protein VTN00DRAFT_8547 [Thermoascus crustaceus]|uniref:uncharacterized protein n=1 Tax=Thermoascus crustaceus TaxID=5088 RepID=UPI00374208C7
MSEDRTCQLNDWPRHKPDCRPQNYILKVNLHPRFITDPRISRTLSCPATSTFAALHRALQVAFGWAGAHLYQFEVFNDDDTSGRENRRLGPEPVLRLTDLSEVTNDYLPNCKESSEYRLHQVLEDENPTTGGGRGRKNKTIHYTYDFGDGWEHIVSCAGRARGTEHFQCLDGEGHESAEDVGGYTGWKRLLEAFDLAKRNEKELSLDQDEMIKWYKEECRNGQKEGLGGREKWRWDRDLVNERLREVMVS